MPWSDITSWDDTTIWHDVDELDAVQNIELPVYFPAPVILDMTAGRRLPGETITAPFADIRQDTEFTSVVPAGCILEKILCIELAGVRETLNFGTTPGDSDVNTILVPPYGHSVIPIDMFFSMTTDTTIYLNAPTWSNGQAYDIYFILLKVI